MRFSNQRCLEGRTLDRECLRKRTLDGEVPRNEGLRVQPTESLAGCKKEDTASMV